MAKKFEYRDGKFFRPTTSCANGQSIFAAAEEKWGKNTYVDPWCSAHHFMPNPEIVEKYGQPIGEVVVRARESFWVYRIQ